LTRKTASKPGRRTRSSAAAETFMRMLREDHAGLSRVLREVDAQQSLLQSTPGSARPVLAEAMRYLLVYQHSIHHRREDQLFQRVRAREPRLYHNMQRLVREHRVGQEQAAQLAGELSRATLGQLRGKTGLRLAQQLQQYVQHTRDHMRREEAVFYKGSERVLRAADWTALLAGPMSRDPAGDPERFAARYPRLAERMSRPRRDVTGPGETSCGTDLRARVERVVERGAALLHQAIDVAQSIARAAVRKSPGRCRASDSRGTSRAA
jgi:hemerythrin-like domain-containing protein